MNSNTVLSLGNPFVDEFVVDIMIPADYNVDKAIKKIKKKKFLKKQIKNLKKQRKKMKMRFRSGGIENQEMVRCVYTQINGIWSTKIKGYCTW